MFWDALISALALLFVIEGILPFLSPPFWRRSLTQMMGLSDRSVRLMGLASMLLGLIILLFVRKAVGE